MGCNGTASLAHDLKNSDTSRTEDIFISEDVDFRSLLLPDFILRGLAAANFQRPSPIQLRSIPLLRLGLDLIVQSKAGTGKTLVIAMAALETVKFESKRLQVIVVAPTREIALQTKNFISIISSDVPVRTEAFIGGTSVKEDRKNLVGCQIVVGTPGRLNSLIESGFMSLCHVRLFVLDEADKLMEKSIFSQVKSISKLLPSNKQTILCSATFLQPVKAYVMKHMKEPFWVSSEGASRLGEGNLEPKKPVSTVLLGVKQFMREVTNHAQIVQKLKFKLEEILEILAGHSFTQCIIFSNYQTRAETICHQLVTNGWPAISIRGQDDQSHRTATLTSFKELCCRVLLTTDVMSRGVDFKGVDLVINLDIPYDSATYLHRMGRAGRFGSHGCVITLASSGEEVEGFKKIISEIDDIVVYTLPSDLQLMKDLKKGDIFFHSFSKRECDDRKEELKSISISANLASTVKDISIKESDQIFCSEAKDPCQSSSFDSLSCDKKREKVVCNATSQLTEALCVSKQPITSLYTFENLETMCSNWTLNTEDKSNLSSSNNLAKPQNWWASANIVLTAANLQLEELKKKNCHKTEDRPLTDSTISNESSDQQSCLELKEENVRRKKKKNKKRRKPMKNAFYHHTQETDDNRDATASSEGAKYQWLWDDTSNVYYLWDKNHLCYYLYNPSFECYFKWDPSNNRYYKWDTESQSYVLWDCESRNLNPNSYLNNSTVFPSVGSSDDMFQKSCISWYNLWSKQLRQISSHVYQAEYLKSMCQASKKL